MAYIVTGVAEVFVTVSAKGAKSPEEALSIARSNINGLYPILTDTGEKDKTCGVFEANHRITPGDIHWLGAERD